MAPTPDELVGGNMRDLRMAAGLSQRDVAEAMAAAGFDWRRGIVGQVESGDRRVALDELAAVAAFFELPPIALLIGPGSMSAYSEVKFGSTTVPAQTWRNLWAEWPWQKEPSPRPHRQAIDYLFAKCQRPWARRWRSKKGHPAESFRLARLEVLGKRTRFPGPSYLVQTPTSIVSQHHPWGAETAIKLTPGDVYVARDEVEAELLANLENTGAVRRVSAQAAFEIRKRRRREGGSK